MPTITLSGYGEIPAHIIGFLAWFTIWCPVVALLEYATHRWIMHKANRSLDPDLRQLKSHGKHHQGDNHPDMVDMPVRNALRLTAPFFLLIFAWGLFTTGLHVTLAPAASLLTWCFLYVYLWNCMHRAIHRIEINWFRRSGPMFRFFRRHHLMHHKQPLTNYGTVFPFTDYLFFTWATKRKSHRVAVNPVS